MAMIDRLAIDRLAGVPRLGLGLAAVGRPGYINLGRDTDLPADRTVAALRERVGQLLDQAYAAGVRYFDVARSYGRAEEFLAGWLPGHDDAVVGSKWGYTYTADWRVEVDVVIVKEAMANGRLAATDGPLAGIAAELGATPDAVALAAVLDQPWARVVLSGAATGAQLAANLAAGPVALTDRHRTQLAALAETPNAYWDTRSRLTWS